MPPPDLAGAEPPAHSQSASVAERSWHAELHLGFERSGARTQLCARRHVGPLRVQKPFYPEGPGVCHVYVLHPPGGLVGGDSLNLHCRVGAQAHSLITTPAAGKVYRTTGATSRQCVQARLEAGATLEWLPQETIVFAGAKARLQTRVDLESGARAILWDVLCLGRPASGERFSEGSVANAIELSSEGRPIIVERAHLQGGCEALQAAWGLGGHPALGTLVAYPATPEALDAARSVAGGGCPLFASTCVGDALVVRAFGDDATQVRLYLTAVWQALRPLILELPAALPRIWAT